MYENTFPQKRYKHTLTFLQKHITPSATILDLGVANPFSAMMQSQGYRVDNTQGEDLDLEVSGVAQSQATVVTAFEILEHLVAPFTVLRAIKARKLVASIPLLLWFAPAYQSKTDPWDRHYHEFEDWQFNWLLEKAGWTVKDTAKWTNPTRRIGLRPLLRLFTPRYYIVYAERLGSDNYK